MSRIPGALKVNPVSEKEFLQRQNRLGKLMEKEGFDAVFMLGYNARYMSGYNPLLENVAYVQTANGDKFLFPGPECRTLALADAKGIPEKNILITSDTMISGEGYPYVLDEMQPLSKILAKYRKLKWGIVDAGGLPADMYFSLESALGNFKDASHLLMKMRRIKSPEEIAIMRECYRIAGKAMAEGYRAAQPGALGYEVARAMAAVFYSEGVQQLSEIFMANSGPETEPCLNRPSARKIKSGEYVIVDVGGVLHGYYSDTARTFIAGSKSDRKSADSLKVAYEAFEAAFCAMGPGVRGKDVDKVARSIIEKHFPTNMVYQIAHSVGVEHCEGPHCQPVGPFVELVLEPGMVFALDTGIWGIPLGGSNGVPKYVGGIRLEDGVLITEDGAERLTPRFPTDPHLTRRHRGPKGL